MFTMGSSFDFAELRDKILFGEGEEVGEEEEEVQSPFRQESRESLTILPFCVAAATFGIVGYDRMKNDGAMFDGYTPAVLMLGGFLPLGYSLGRLSRGMVAQSMTAKYERILDEAQATIEETEEKAQEAEQKAAEHKKNDYRMDYLDAELSSSHEPSIFGGSVSAFGQEGVSFRPVHKPHDRLF